MRHAILFGNLVLIFGFSIFSASCQATPRNELDTTPVSQNFVDEAVVPSALSYVDDSYVLARGWSTDAILIGVGVDIPANGQTSVFYSFISKTNSKEIFYPSFINGKSTTRVFDWNAPYSSFQEIELDDWIIDSPEALRIAQKSGGLDFINDTSGKIDISLDLMYLDDGTLIWRISYRSLSGEGTKFIGVNATTGEKSSSKQ